MSIPRIPKDISCECGCQHVHWDPHGDHWELWCPDCGAGASGETKAETLKDWKQTMLKIIEDHEQPIVPIERYNHC